MSAQNYSPFVERMIFKYEGNYGWHHSDPGGPTKYGITCWDLAEYLGQKMNSMSEWAPKVAAMTLHTADEIYRNKYASKCRFDDLNAGCDCVVFDFGVNSGPSRSIRYAQAIVHTTGDGVLGLTTLAAINAMDPAVFVNRLCASRLTFLHNLGTWGTFGRGWSARVRDLRAYSLALITPPAVAVADKPQPKEVRLHLAFAKGAHEAEMAA